MNPYRPAPGSDPPVLAGRDPELDIGRQAIELTRDGGAARPIVLTGLRGMGKTALLRRLEREVRTKKGIVLTGEATNQGSLSATLRAGLQDARRELSPISTRLRGAVDVALSALPEASFELPDHLGSVSVKTAKPKEHERLASAIDALNIEIRKHGRWLAIALDEVQQGDVATLDALISVIHKTAGTDEPVLFLAAGLRSAKAHLVNVRTYTERYRYVELGLLSLSETMDAIQEPARKNGTPFTPEALDSVAEASKGYPFFVQELASTVWSRRDPANKHISKREVDEIIPVVKRSLERDFYGDPIARLTARELAYVVALASLGDGQKQSGAVSQELGVTSSQTSSIRQSLVRKDIIYAPDSGLVEFRVPLMAEYVMEHRGELVQSSPRRSATE